MQQSVLDSDGFQKINRKKSAKKVEPRREHGRSSTFAGEINLQVIKKKIKEAKEEVITSEYWESTQNVLNSVSNKGELCEIVCFGLGHFGECIISRYQLAFLLCITEVYKAPVKIHDPIFHSVECELLLTYGLEVISENAEGLYRICQDKLTLVYMPHCPKQLTNNFLWFNFTENLKNCILISNSFENIVHANLKRVLENSAFYINKLQPYTREDKLKNSFRFSDIFNDTSIHTFPESNLTTLSKEFWLKGTKPEYTDDTEFITSQMIEKLKF